MQTIDDILNKYEKNEDNLIQILNEVQEMFGYIPKFSQIEISKYLGIELAQIYGVITFYSRFMLNKKGKHSVSICMGTACYVKGAQKLLDELTKKLEINVGETTSDGLFTIEENRCVGACSLAPILIIDNEVYGNATVELLNEKLEEIKRGNA